MKTFDKIFYIILFSDQSDHLLITAVISKFQLIKTLLVINVPEYK